MISRLIDKKKNNENKTEIQIKMVCVGPCLGNKEKDAFLGPDI